MADWKPLLDVVPHLDNSAPVPPETPIVQPPSLTEQRVFVGPIIRDVIILWVLTGIGGFAAGLATGGPQRDAQQFIIAVAASNLLLGTVGFTVVGCLAPPNRWRHLAFVALGVWITSLINVVFFGVGLAQWIGSAIFMAIVMGIGGAISYLFKRNGKPYVHRGPSTTRG